MKKLLAITLALALLFCSCSSTNLYEYALTMDDSTFVGTDGEIYTAHNYNCTEDNTVLLEKSGERIPWRIVNDTAKATASEMALYSYLHAKGTTVYIRNDGTLWTQCNNQNILVSPYSSVILADVPPDPPVHDIDIAFSQSTSYLYVQITNNSESILRSPAVYLFVQLADGKWYIHDTGGDHRYVAERGLDATSPPVVHPKYGVLTSNLLDINIDLDEGESMDFSFRLPPINGDIIEGNYRIALYSNLANEYTYNKTEYTYQTWPISNTAQLEAIIDFHAEKSRFGQYKYKISDIESTIKNITIK